MSASLVYSAEGVWCAIPCFNAGPSVIDVARRAREILSSVLVVDDGSTDLDISAALAGDDISVLRHEENLGKGAALRSAFQFARERGAEFLVVLDADGQHDPDDLSRLLPLLDPTRIVIGARDMTGPNVPDSSRFGRAFSDFWVHTEAGVAVTDSQSGFRAYPLALISKLSTRCTRYDFEVEILTRALWAGLESRSVPIGVHYPPAGLRISHFQPWIDNLRFSLLHTRLVLRQLLPWPHRRLVKRRHLSGGALSALRAGFVEWFRRRVSNEGLTASAVVGTLIGSLPLPLPAAGGLIMYAAWRLTLNTPAALAALVLVLPARILLPPESGYITAPFFAAMAGVAVHKILTVFKPLRPMPQAPARMKPHRTQNAPARKRGNSFGYWWFTFLVRMGGLPAAYSFLHVVCAFYVLFDGDACASASAYLRRRFPSHGRLKRLLDIHRLFVNQGMHLVDRYCHVSGAVKYAIDLDKEALLRETLARESGAILITAHVGSWQMAMTKLRVTEKRIHVVMKQEGNQAAAAALNLTDPRQALQFITPDSHLGGVLEILEAINSHEVVCMMGDRPYDFTTIRHPFLGDEASFPLGPFKLASAAGCPVIVLFSTKTGRTRHEARIADVIAPPSDGVKLSAGAILSRFAAALEKHVMECPYECFLFQDVWNAPNRKDSAMVHRK